MHQNINGKISWKTTSQAIWTNANQVWVVGSLGDIGSDKRQIVSSTKGKAPFDIKDKWYYHNGFRWKKPAENGDLDITCMDAIGIVTVCS